MDVHPPHEPVHSWRDALVHLAIMTVGLFIALSLESLVEYFHHKELVHQARENIRREIEGNHANAQKDIAFLSESAAKIKAGVATLRYIQTHRDAKDRSISFTVNFVDLSDAAWRTARDSGALGYMPLDEVQKYASLYGLQDTVTEQAMHLLTRQAEELAPIVVEDETFAQMSDAEFAAMRQAGGTNFTDVYVLQQIVRNFR